MNQGYTTNHEVDFVLSIRDKNCLRGYIEAANKRSDWGCIDKAIVLAAAKDRLEKLNARGR